MLRVSEVLFGFAHGRLVGLGGSACLRLLVSCAIDVSPGDGQHFFGGPSAPERSACGLGFGSAERNLRLAQRLLGASLQIQVWPGVLSGLG